MTAGVLSSAHLERALVQVGTFMLLSSSKWKHLPLPGILFFHAATPGHIGLTWTLWVYGLATPGHTGFNRATPGPVS